MIRELPGESTRLRCAGCGNLTRFDVTRRVRSHEFWHLDLAGEVEIEERTALEEEIESIMCRWCGRSDAIELVDRDSGSATPTLGQ